MNKAVATEKYTCDTNNVKPALKYITFLKNVFAMTRENVTNQKYLEDEEDIPSESILRKHSEPPYSI